MHNHERATVGARPLQWDSTLAANASAYAQHLAQTGQLIHAPREGRGIARENLLAAPMGWSTDRMMNLWIGEKRDFTPGLFPNVARDGNLGGVLHYTQMIWPTTTYLGCGMAPGGAFDWLVCRYSPGGNKDGKPVGQGPVVAQATTSPSRPAATAYQWIDAKTGKPVPLFPQGVRPDLLDPNRAFDPRTGQNFVKVNGSWIDAKTGKPVPSGPQGVPPDLFDPNRAFDPRTGQNFVKVPTTDQPAHRP